jgi:hypothetical protein
MESTWNDRFSHLPFSPFSDCYVTSHMTWLLCFFSLLSSNGYVTRHMTWLLCFSLKQANLLLNVVSNKSKTKII